MKKIMFFAIIMAFALCVSAQFANQPEFNFSEHQVMPGESLRKISHIYYGSENTTLILTDNPWLYGRPNFNTAGEVVNYRIYPGDVLKVRIYGQQSQPIMIEPTGMVLNNYPTETATFTDTPTFWLMFAFLVAVAIGFLLLLGYIWGQNRNNNNNFQHRNTGNRTYIRHEEHYHPTEVHVLLVPVGQVAKEKPATDQPDGAKG